ncbi:SKP1-like protein 1 [Vitis riparia]|uniref:SKP1-like protein 1 n=1 Tax=Vitis riparia TaxID=96939 RepID=UPI00155B2666|nr:SKP1-like protein 1 [Vitis riparia]
MAKTVNLKSSDGHIFTVEEAVALQCQTIKNVVEDTGDDEVLLPKVNGKTLAKVMEYCEKHAKEPSGLDQKKVDEMKKWDMEFVDVDQAVLYDMLMAANYLSIAGLIELICMKAADMIRGKSPEQIREIFKIENDFTKEEEAKIRGENAWAFE